MTKKEEAWYFSHWISSSVKNIQAHSGLVRYLFGNDKKKRRNGIFLTGFHPALKTFKPIRAWKLFLEFLSIYRDSRLRSIHSRGIEKAGRAEPRKAC
jgi:hypothetical protein